MLSVFSCVQLCVALWTAARQAPLSMGLSRQEHRSGLPFPTPVYLPNPGIEPVSLMSLHWQVGSLPLVPTGKPLRYNTKAKIRKEIIDKLDFVKNKCFISVKPNIKIM